MTVEELKTWLHSELPELLKQDQSFQQWLEQLIRQTAVSHETFDARFERILQEFAADRAERRREWEEWSSKFDAHAEEQNRKWEEQNNTNKKLLDEFDDEGLVFGRPDQVEIDIIIKNGDVILYELKSSMSKSDMYTFDRKVQYYERGHRRPVQRKLVISPMVHPTARPVAEHLGIEVFSYVEDTTGF